MSGVVAPRPGMIGPNAVIQLGNALRERMNPLAARNLFSAAGILEMLTTPPSKMVSETVVARLYDALFRIYPKPEAIELAADAGRRTAAYVMAHRIPGPARLLLRLLPPRFAGPLLLRAIARHAWTFAGSGAVSTRVGGAGRWEIAIADNPLMMPDCAWHGAVFEALFQALVSPDARVTHGHAHREGRSVCHFAVALAATPPA